MPEHIFDTAIPQGWFDHVLTRTGANPSGHIVWCYADSPMFGEPVATDEVGRRIMRAMSANPRNPEHYHPHPHEDELAALQPACWPNRERTDR